MTSHVSTISTANPLLLAAQSLKHFANAALFFFYGTPKRTNITLFSAMALLLIAGTILPDQAALHSYCGAAL